MADASCSGPSPFKRLVDHQSRDVSHRQDRLIDRSGQQHGAFRSSRRQAHSEAPFNDFVDGAPSSGTTPGMPHDPANRLAVHAAALQQPGAGMNPRHGHTHPGLPHQARASPAPDVANWAADFARFSATPRMRSSPVVAGSSPAVQSPHQQQGPVRTSFRSAFGQAFPSPMHAGPAATSGFVAPRQAAPEADFNKEVSQWMSAHGKADMTEVDAAMDRMARELQRNEAALPADAQEIESSTPATAAGLENRSSSRYTDLGSPEISNLSLLERDSPPEQRPANVPGEPVHSLNGNDAEAAAAAAAAAERTKSAVSEAAERLLDSVQHENGQKWQNSVFLSLMRDFRDGKKDIVDDEICDTAARGEQPST